MKGKEFFPLWRPHYRTEEKFYGNDKRAYNALRSASSSFIKNKVVRELISKKSEGKCVCCGSTENLQIDHIISVYSAFKNKNLITILNTYQNLQLLCRKCNSGKRP